MYFSLGLKNISKKKGAGYWYGYGQHRPRRGPTDCIYTDEGVDPRKSPWLAKGEKIWCPKGGDTKKPVIRSHAKRRRIGPRAKGQYKKVFPSAAKVAAAQAKKPAKYAATTTSRTLVVGGPGWRIRRVPAPDPRRLDDIRAGRIPGLSMGDDGVIRTHIDLDPGEAIPEATEPYREGGGDPYMHFLRGE